MPSSSRKKNAGRDSRVQVNLKIEKEQAALLRQLARRDGRTISGFIQCHFFSKLSPDMLNGHQEQTALSPAPANEQLSQ